MRELTEVLYSPWPDEPPILPLKSPSKAVHVVPPQVDSEPPMPSPPFHSEQQQRADFAQAMDEFTSSFSAYLGAEDQGIAPRQLSRLDEPALREVKEDANGEWSETDTDEDEDTDEDAEFEYYEIEDRTWTDPFPDDLARLTNPTSVDENYSAMEDTSDASLPSDFVPPPTHKPTCSPLLSAKSVFIPPLSQARSAHPSMPYPNEDEEQSDSYDDISPSDTNDEETKSNQEANRDGGSGVIPDRRSRFSSISSRSHVNSTKSRSVSLKRKHGWPGTLRRTQIPAVEDDPTIVPYGCHLCWTRLVQSEKPKKLPFERRRGDRKNGDHDDDDNDGESEDACEDSIRSSKHIHPPDQEGISSFRTIRELREHVSSHRRANEIMGETPFRCSIDPCGKTFKSAAGLLWHFTNASGGHFYVSMEEGESKPTKKFKRVIEATDRTERCPVEGCTKAFKQAAGLAYHLAHASDHPEKVTEVMLSSFHPKLASKTRWHFSRLGIEIAS